MVNIVADTFEKFLYSYAIFLFFLIFIMGMGASQYIGGNLAGLHVPEPPVVPDSESGGIIDWITSGVDSFVYFRNNIGFFFELMRVDTGVAWLGTLIFAPAIVFLIYGFLKLIRGGG